ncbi:hypothetical protein GCM10027422_43240 [Hymenobacter arcticus]
MTRLPDGSQRLLASVATLRTQPLWGPPRRPRNCRQVSCRGPGTGWLPVTPKQPCPLPYGANALTHHLLTLLVFACLIGWVPLQLPARSLRQVIALSWRSG